MQNIIVDGIYTHCSSSDEKDPSYTNLQIKRFKEVLAGLEEIKLPIPLRHMANSGAVIGHPDAHFNAVQTRFVFIRDVSCGRGIKEHPYQAGNEL